MTTDGSVPLAEKVVRLHETLAAAGLTHAFGGALALAYCTAEPRTTRDVDLNVFVAPEEAGAVFAILPPGVQHDTADRELAERDGQVRVWWDITPIDLFFAYHDFHRHAANQRRMVPFARGEIPVIDGTDLVVFKAFFDRPKDWVDIEEVAIVGGADFVVASNWLVDLLGADDPRVGKLESVRLAHPR